MDENEKYDRFSLLRKLNDLYLYALPYDHKDYYNYWRVPMSNYQMHII